MFGLLKVSSYYKVNVISSTPTATGVSLSVTAPVEGYMTVIVMKDNLIIGCGSSEIPFVTGIVELSLPEDYRGAALGSFSVFCMTLGPLNDNNRFIGKTLNSVWFQKIGVNDIYRYNGDKSTLMGAQIITVPTVGLIINVSFTQTGISTAHHGIIV